MGIFNSNETGGAPIINKNRVSVIVSRHGTQGISSTMDPSQYQVLKAGECLIDEVNRCNLDWNESDLSLDADKDSPTSIYFN